MYKVYTQFLNISVQVGMYSNHKINVYIGMKVTQMPIFYMYVHVYKL